MKLFSGTSNRPLAEKLGFPLGNVEITRFIDNECRVFVKEDVAGEEVYVLQSLSVVADQNLVELCLLGQALKGLGAKQVTAVIPWMGYSKQDKAFRRGEAISMQLVAKCIEVAGFDAVLTFDLHSELVLQYFRIPVTELSARTLLAEATRIILVGNDAVVVSPDKGGRSRSETFAKEQSLPVVYLEKIRSDDGTVTIHGIRGDVSEKPVIIFDDIINTGETAIKTSEFLQEKGAKEIFFLATHAVLAGNAPSLLQKSDIDKIIVTDTIDIPDDKRFEKLSIVSIAHELASHITDETH